MAATFEMSQWSEALTVAAAAAAAAVAAAAAAAAAAQFYHKFLILPEAIGN